MTGMSELVRKKGLLQREKSNRCIVQRKTPRDQFRTKKVPNSKKTLNLTNQKMTIDFRMS